MYDSDLYWRDLKNSCNFYILHIQEMKNWGKEGWVRLAPKYCIRYDEQRMSIKKILTAVFRLIRTHITWIYVAVLGISAITVIVTFYIYKVGKTENGIGSLDLTTVKLESGDLEMVQPESGQNDEGLHYFVYQIIEGDTISELSKRFNISADSIISINGIKNAKTLQINQYLRIPSMNGILYHVKKDDTIEKIAENYKISAERIQETNDLSDDPLVEGLKLFLPDARLPNYVINEINGDLFRWPVNATLSSWYGWRRDPFSGSRIFHDGIDLAAPLGTSVRAAMDGVISQTGYNTISGNFIIIKHASGYASFYGHLNKLEISVGTKVKTGSKIATVGNSGYSTSSHLHFTVFKYGRTINPVPLLY